jgi:hypothetical protein
MKILTKCPSEKDLKDYFNLIETGIDYHDLPEYMAMIDYHLVEMNCPKCNEKLCQLEEGEE